LSFPQWIQTVTLPSYSAEYICLELIVFDGARIIGIDYLEEWVDEFSLD